MVRVPQPCMVLGTEDSYMDDGDRRLMGRHSFGLPEGSWPQTGGGCILEDELTETSWLESTRSATGPRFLRSRTDSSLGHPGLLLIRK